MSLSDALLDLKIEAIRMGGRPDAAFIAEVAADYSLNPALVGRKFDESYPHPEQLAATAAATDSFTHTRAAIAATVDQYLAAYTATREQLRDVFFEATRYTVIGRISRTHLLAVRHTDGSGWRIPASRAHAA